MFTPARSTRARKVVKLWRLRVFQPLPNRYVAETGGHRSLFGFGRRRTEFRNGLFSAFAVRSRFDFHFRTPTTDLRLNSVRWPPRPTTRSGGQKSRRSKTARCRRKFPTVSKRTRTLFYGSEVDVQIIIRFYKTGEQNDRDECFARDCLAPLGHSIDSFRQ